MAHRRTKWVTMVGIGLLVLGYMVGRQHQSATVATCIALAGSLDQMVTMYEEANTEMWKALGVMSRFKEQVALPASDDFQ